MVTFGKILTERDKKECSGVLEMVYIRGQTCLFIHILSMAAFQLQELSSCDKEWLDIWPFPKMFANVWSVSLSQSLCIMYECVYHSDKDLLSYTNNFCIILCVNYTPDEVVEYR